MINHDEKHVTIITIPTRVRNKKFIKTVAFLVN